MRIAQLIRSFRLAVLVALVAGCLPAGDENNEEVGRLLQVSDTQREAALLAMTPRRQAEMLRSAWKRHPSNRAFNKPLAAEGLALASELVRLIDDDDGYVVTVEMLDFFRQMRDSGGLDEQAMRTLSLDGVCSRNAPGERYCIEAAQQLGVKP